MTSAREYNRRQVEAGKLTLDHITELVRFWQATNDLDDDGKAGPQTITALEIAMGVRVELPKARCWPLRLLADGRKPTITSGFRNPQRKNHAGADVMYAYKAGDPYKKIGDSGRTAKWWVPDGTLVVAMADGVVELAGKTDSGWRVWLRHPGGYATGYVHLTQLFVSAGNRVALGDSLGIVGDNPADYDADHLHLELMRGDLTQRAAGLEDPAKWLNGAEYLEHA